MTGPFSDDGAPFSAIGKKELRLPSHKDMLRSFHLDPRLKSLSSYDWWQFESGPHSSSRRSYFGIINTSVNSDNNNTVLIRHLVVQGSFQWIISRYVTRASDVLHFSGCKSFDASCKLFLKFD